VDADLKRYVEFLQRQLLTAGAEDIFNATRALSALAERADHLRGVCHRQTGHGEAVDDLLQMQSGFTPETAYEVPQTSTIFQPPVADFGADLVQITCIDTPKQIDVLLLCGHLLSLCKVGRCPVGCATWLLVGPARDGCRGRNVRVNVMTVR
jgi:hypothetical protein